MNRNEQEYHRNIKRIADALEKLANKEDRMKGIAESGPVQTKPFNRVKHI